VDSGRESLSVRASPRLCQTPAKLPAEEEEEEAAAARVPLRARPAPRRPRSRCCCQKTDPDCTSANYGGERGERERRKASEGSGGVRWSKPRSPADGRQQLCWREQGVRASPPSAQNTYSKLCLWSVVPPPVPPLTYENLTGN